jgi:catalase
MAGATEIRRAPLALEGTADHWNFREDDDDYYPQPGLLFRLIGPEKQQLLSENTARAIGGAPREIQIRHIGNCMKADPAYGKGIADALGIPLSEVPLK